MSAEERTRLLGRLAGLLACHDIPDPLPAEPMSLLASWFENAKTQGNYDDFNAMTLATSTPDGAPSARVVLCKQVEVKRHSIVFYTSYSSRKGRELEANPRAAAVLYWPHARRQARIEGRIERTTPEESDAYFATRPLLSRIGATVSDQSAPMESRARVVARAIKIATSVTVGSSINRPPNWGGYRLLADRVELWSDRPGRLHDRAVWIRDPALNIDSAPGQELPTWSACWLGA